MYYWKWGNCTKSLIERDNYNWYINKNLLKRLSGGNSLNQKFKYKRCLMLLNCHKFQMPFILQLQIWQDSVGNQPAKKKRIILRNNWKTIEEGANIYRESYLSPSMEADLTGNPGNTTGYFGSHNSKRTKNATSPAALTVGDPNHRLVPPQNANHSPCPVSLRPGVNTKASSNPMGKKKAM